MYPIEVHYRPIAGERNDEALFATEKAEGKSIRSMSTRDTDAKPYLRILQEVDQQVPANERGDLLIFMSGIKEVREVYTHTYAYACTYTRALYTHAQILTDTPHRYLRSPSRCGCMARRRGGGSC